ncbi:hypothetical protein HK44_002150 [Pseudomonas fluorescens HK44]|uniref:Bacterial mobilisation domain-containing protein n=1 Tax=Pseudomonas fluorescens HK44 TaxID=1042209 RepID=A0A010STS6_PSEFL|nr:hypothetical protein HK44_002150 [Pseudomonas fluorescens HK44]
MYFNEVEYIELCGRVKKRIELCDYIRAQVFAGKTPYSVTVPELNLQAYSELARAAANLNQIARQLNIDSDPFDFDQLRKELHAFRMALIQGAL